MKKTEEIIDRTAKLARLSVSEEEKLRIKDDFAKILEYIDEIAALDLAGYEPMASACGNENVFRVDEAVNGLSFSDALKNAPQKDGGFFVVPKTF